MSRNEALFRRYEKLTREAKKVSRKSKDRPVSCPFGAEKDVFRKKPLRRDGFS